MIAARYALLLLLAPMLLVGGAPIDDDEIINRLPVAPKLSDILGEGLVSGAASEVTITDVSVSQDATVIVVVSYMVSADPQPPDGVTWNSLPLTMRYTDGDSNPHPHLSVWTRDDCSAATGSVVIDLTTASPTTATVSLVYEATGTSLVSTDQTVTESGVTSVAATGFVTLSQPDELLFGCAAWPVTLGFGIWTEGMVSAGITGTDNLTINVGARRVTGGGQFRARTTGGPTVWTIGLLTLR